MNPKYQKVLSDIEKAEKKKTEIEGQLKELYDKKTELENLEIINTVRSMVMDKDQILSITIERTVLMISRFSSSVFLSYSSLS